MEKEEQSCLSPSEEDSDLCVPPSEGECWADVLQGCNNEELDDRRPPGFLLASNKYFNGLIMSSHDD